MDRSAWVSLGMLGLLAVLPPWLAPRRPAAVELRAPRQIVVTSPADRGPGSLREALVTAGSFPERTRIVVEPTRIELEDPLPPLVNPLGIVVDAGAAGCVIDASRLLTGSAFDLAAPNSALSGLTVRGAPSHAILIRADRARLQHLVLEDNAEGVRVAEGLTGVVIEDSTFRDNGTGIRLGACGPGVAVRRNVFERHDEVALSALRGEPLPGASSELRVVHNRFSEDRVSLVLGNVAVVVEDNDLLDPFEAAVYLTGSGATIRRNRIRGAPAGIRAESLRGGRISGNEIGGGQVAILTSASRGVVIESNRLYDNLAGIVMVLADSAGPNQVSSNLLLGHADAGIVLVGSSPAVRGNRSLGNRVAGLRLTDFVRSDGVLAPAEPELAANVLAGDAHDLVRERARAEAADLAGRQDEPAGDDPADSDTSPPTEERR